MEKCPVCEIELAEPLPPSCGRCTWVLHNGKIFLHPITASEREEHQRKLEVARRNWNEKSEAIERQKKQEEELRRVQVERGTAEKQRVQDDKAKLPVHTETSNKRYDNLHHAVSSYKVVSLHEAAFRGDTNALMLLLAAGADINANDGDRQTPLHRAAENGHIDAVKALLQAGANVNAKGGYADINKDRYEETPLHKAAYNGHIDTIKALLQAGANSNARANDLKTPLHKAAYNGHIDAIKALLQAGAFVRSTDNDNKNGVHYAALNGHTETVGFLLAYMESAEKAISRIRTLDKVLATLILCAGGLTAWLKWDWIDAFMLDKLSHIDYTFFQGFCLFIDFTLIFSGAIAFTGCRSDQAYLTATPILTGTLFILAIVLGLSFMLFLLLHPTTAVVGVFFVVALILYINSDDL